MSSGLRDGMNTGDGPPMVAIRAVSDEVSMTKITLRPDHAAFAAQVLELDQSSSRRFEPVPPLHHHRPLVEQLVEPEVPQLRWGFDPIEVDMRELHTPRVHAHELKGWARDRSDRRCASGHAANKGGLPRSQLARQQDHVTRAQPLSKALAEGLG